MLMWRQTQRPPKHTVKKRSIKTKKQPAWDSTVRDLTVHQLSKEELELRRSRILSKNAEKAKRELEEISKDVRQLRSACSHRGSTEGKPSNKIKLHSVLEESDRAIAVVKDLFGDDPKRYSAHPNVTVAPHVTTDKSALQRTLLENQRDGPTPSALNTPGGIRDESILGLAPVKPALNELPSPSSEFTISDSTLEGSSLLSPDQTTPPPSSYHPAVVDLPRFQRLVEQGEGVKETRGEEKEVGGETTPTNTGANIIRGTALGTLPHGLEADQLSSIPHTGSQQGDTTVVSNQTTGGETKEAERQGESGSSSHLTTNHGRQHPLHIVHKMPLQSGTRTESHPTAFAQERKQVIRNNDVARNQRHRRLPPGSVSSSSKCIHDELSILQELVDNLEQELQEYEQTSGYCFPVQRPAMTQSGTFSSLTASLLASVTKLTHYLKQSEVQLKGEVAVRNQLLHAMAEQQNLMDALTADVVKLQEENSSLKGKFQQLEEHTTQQAKTLEENITELRTMVSSLEQVKSLHLNKEPTRPFSESTLLPAPTMTSSAARTLTPLCEPEPNASKPLPLQAKLHSIAPVSLPLASQQVELPSMAKSSSEQRPHLYAPLGGNHSLTPTYVMSSSAPYLQPATPSAIPLSLSPLLTHESTTPAYHATGAKDETPLAYFNAPSLPVGGLSLASISPSECGVSPPPISVALQVPSLNSGPQLQPYSLSFQTPSPLLPHNLPSHTVPPTSFPATLQPTKLPLSLPYSWMAPPMPPPVPVTVGGFSSAMYSTPAQSSISSNAFPSAPLSSSVSTVPSQLQLTTPAPAVSLPNLSLTNMSLAAPDTSTLSEGIPPSGSNSSLDIEASLARMSSLARSVLKELAEDRGQLLKVTEPMNTPSLPVSTPLHSSSVRPLHLPARSSVSSNMTSVTSLDSPTDSQSSVGSAVLDYATTLEENTQPPPTAAAQSAGKISSTPLQT